MANLWALIISSVVSDSSYPMTGMSLAPVTYGGFNNDWDAMMQSGNIVHVENWSVRHLRGFAEEFADCCDELFKLFRKWNVSQSIFTLHLNFTIFRT